VSRRKDKKPLLARRGRQPIDHGHITFEEYTSIRAVNWSTLRELRRSPLHYRHRLSEPAEETTAMLMGRAVHTAVLEPDRFPLDYVVWEGGRRAGREWDDFKAAAGSKTILREEDYARCLAIRDAVRGHAVASAQIVGGRAEVAAEWTDPGTMIRCKSRIDYISNRALIDLKTCRLIDGRLFGASAATMGYHNQLAFAFEGVKQLGMSPAVKIVAVESQAPHDVAVFALDEDVLATAGEENAQLLSRLVGCRERDEWPGTYPDEMPLALPLWAMKYEDDMSGLGLIVADGDGGGEL
jgi:exodeoxyribonuclease VIII